MRLRLASAGCLVVSLSLPLVAQDVYRVSDQITAPKVAEIPKPRYSATTMRAKVNGLVGVVELEVDVMPDGSVGTVALVRSAGQELDEMAAEAARRFKFTPGTKGGKPVAVRISLKLQIDLHSGGAPMRLLDPSPNPN